MKITPSILNANLANLEAEIARIPSADAVHVDVMDGHFVPNLSIGLPVVESIRKATDAFLDVHLMIEDPDRWAPAYVDAGADCVTFHAEAATAPIKLAREIRSLGCRVGFSLRPATPIEHYAAMLGEFDQVLIMTVEPGFGGQKFLDLCLPKIRKTRELINELNLDIDIQVDGGIAEDTIDRVVDAGANVFVAGSAVYKAADPDAVVQALKARATARAKQ